MNRAEHPVTRAVDAGSSQPEKGGRTVKRLVALVAIIVVGVFLSSCLADVFNAPPQAAITIAEGYPYGPAPLEITFDISASHDPGGQIVSFTLDFGDGTAPFSGTDLSQAISHTYEEPGSYLARVTVTDDRGKTGISPGLVIIPS